MSFKRRLLVGASITAVGQLLTYFIRFGSSLILTRLLAPDLMGLMAVGATFSYAAILFSELGLRNAVIQEERGKDPDYRDSLWTMAIMRGLAVCLVVSLAGAIIWLLQRNGVLVGRSVYSDPRLVTVLLLLGFSEFIRGFESMDVLYRERKLEFKTLVYFNTSKQLVGTAATLIWSWLDPGVWALCAGAIFGHLFTTVVSHVWIAERRARFVWRGAEFLDILFRSRWFLVSSVLTFGMNSIDKLFLASAFTPSQMGIYSIALTLGLLAIDMSTKIGSSVVFPAVSERLREESQKIRADYYKMRHAYEMFALVSGFFLLAFGGDLIWFLYDSRYHEAGTVLRVFGLVSLLIAYAPAVDAYFAMGRPGIASVVNLMRLAGLIVGLGVLVPMLGLVGGAAALVASHLAGALTTLYFNRQIGLFDWKPELRLLGAFAFGLVALGVLEYVRSLVS